MAANVNKEPSHSSEPQVLRLEGILDAEKAQSLAQSIDGLMERGSILIALDFMRVDIVSSAAIRILLDKTKSLEEAGGKLALFSVHDDVHDMLKLAGFEKILHIYPLEGEALSALNS